MEVNLYNHKQIVKSVREEVTLGEFYQILNTYKPTEFFNTMYSEKIPCWYITEYLNANTVMYYANGWADKTPQKITIEKLYQSWRIEGINYTKFYTDKTQEEWVSPMQPFKIRNESKQEPSKETADYIDKPIVDFYTKKDMKRAFDVGFQVGYNDEESPSFLTFDDWIVDYEKKETT